MLSSFLVLTVVLQVGLLNATQACFYVLLPALSRFVSFQSHDNVTTNSTVIGFLSRVVSYITIVALRQVAWLCL